MFDQQAEPENEGYTEVFAWGSNRQKQLGVGQRGTQPLFPVPKLQSFGITISQISCGHQHSGFVASNGLIFMFGSNSEGQLGVGDHSLKASDNPLLVESLSMFQAVALSCGAYHSAAINDKGEIYAWGYGDRGALGYGANESQWFPVRMITQASAASVTPPPQIKGKDVTCGDDHTLVIDVNGKLYATGCNEHGQLGNGTKNSENALVPATGLLEKVGQAAAGAKHSLILTESGKLLGTGCNLQGQLGNGTRHSESVLIQIDTPDLKFKSIHASTFSAGLTEEGDLYLWGQNPSFGESLSPTKEIKLKEIVSVGLGARFVSAIDSLGGVYTWGSGQQGELGIGTYENTEEPEQVGQLESKQATQIAAGSNHVIALGQHVLPSVRSTPVPAGGVNESQSQQQVAQSSQQQLGQSSQQQVVQSSVRQTTYHQHSTSQHQSTGQSTSLAPPPPAISSLAPPPPLNQTNISHRGSPSRSPNAALRNFPPSSVSRAALDRSSSPFQAGRLGQGGRYFNTEAPNTVEDLQSRLTAERMRRQSQDMRGITTSAVRDKPLQEMLEENREQMRQRHDQTRLQSKLSDVETELEAARRENRNLQGQLKQLKEDRKVDSNQLHRMLKEYETKMAQEIDSKHIMVKEKTKEISSLHDHITRLESELASERLQRQRMEDYYSDQIDKVNNSLHLAEKQLGMSSAEADNLQGRHEADASRIGALSLNVQRMNEKITGIELENKHLLKKLANEQELNERLKEELLAESERANSHETELNNVRHALAGVNKQYDEHAGQTVVEIENLRATVNDLNYNKNDLVNQINSAHQEKEDLYREVNTWKEMVNKLTEENTQLKLIIEDLEQKNKRFSETLNTHLYNRAAEFKARAINALKSSHSPFRGRTPDGLLGAVSPGGPPRTPNRGVSAINPGSATTQPMPSAQRLQKMLSEESKNAENEQNIRDMVKTDHDETKAMKDVEEKYSPSRRPRHAVTDFDYGNVMDRGQHGPNKDPRLVNSNYALISNLNDMERGQSPEGPPVVHNPAAYDSGSGLPPPEIIERPPSVAQSVNPNAGRDQLNPEDEPINRSASMQELKDNEPVRQTIKREEEPAYGHPGSTTTTPLRAHKQPPINQDYDPTKPPESGRDIGEPTYYRVDPSTRQIERNRELDNRFAQAQDSTARLTEMLGVDSPIRKSAARRTMASPVRRVTNPEHRAQSSPHPIQAASYNPEAVSPNVVGNPVASHVTAQMVRSTMQKVKAQLEQSKEANQNVSEGLVEYERKMKDREYDQ